MSGFRQKFDHSGREAIVVTTKEAIKDERRRKRQRVREEEEEVGKVRAREKKGKEDCKKRLNPKERKELERER